jgi:hypothetical protein
VQALREAPAFLAGDIPRNGEAHRWPSAAGVLRRGGAAIGEIEASALGITAASFVTDMQGFQLIMNGLVMRMFFLSGALFVRRFCGR